MQTNKKTLVVIGGGAAGFFCAINAAALNKNLQVIIVEKTNKVLSKVKVSGGGRCNVTHNCIDIEALSKHYPRGEKFLKKAFHWFNVKDTIEWFEQRNITLKTESDGRMFSITNTSQTIIDCFIAEVNKYAIEILMSCAISNVSKNAETFELTTDKQKIIKADFVCIACGGYAKESQFDWLLAMGHSIEKPLPSLFTFNIPNNNITTLMGLSVPNAKVKIVGSKLFTQGAMLITHWGLSGPAVLKLSALAAKELAICNYNFEVVINWFGNINEQELQQIFAENRQQFATQKISSKNNFELPNRLWQFLLQASNIYEQKRWADITSKESNALIQTLTNHKFIVKGKTTFKEEFVTCGGIKLNEVDVNTMQSKKIDNLFFAGEILDIDGVTGGFNFQNAWTTGFIAAKSIAIN